MTKMFFEFGKGPYNACRHPSKHTQLDAVNYLWWQFIQDVGFDQKEHTIIKSHLDIL